MPKHQLTPEDAKRVEAILQSAASELQAFAEAGDYSFPSLLSASTGFFALKALNEGRCRSKMLEVLEQALDGRCSCEMETKGTA
jgi:hypothetical protein